ncbi:hypothetical protein [Mycobacteroides abscessus]|uniref:hypothetical protein n=1 Tax=Mycobacteroides abscessus TaxID=36809 RepID=UPI002105CE10|nr:hypothetical protein [Mycobacteroides abscessus]
MAAVDPHRALNAQRLRRARLEYGFSLQELAAEVENVRGMRSDRDIPPRESLRQMIISIERGGPFGEMWRADLAAVFGRDPDEIFSVPVQSPLPHPLLLELPVDEDVLSVITTQRAAHIEAEHAFGAQHARPLVERDLDTVEALIKTAPRRLKRAMAEAAGTIAEVAGWIAQDLGDHAAAQTLTHKAFLHLRAASPELRAMILMRQSNILTRSDASLAVDLVADAAEFIDGRDAGRLTASIARQQALAALHNDDERGFHRHAAEALELGDIEPATDDRAPYAHAAYVASDIASGYLRLGHAEKALELLTSHHTRWTSQQHRDRAVADMRLLHTYIAIRDYRLALALADTAIPAYLSAPSQRARRHLAQPGKLVRDRRRRDTSPVLQELAARIKKATQGAHT